MQAPLSARGGPNLFGVGQDRERQSSSELPQARAELQLLWADDHESFSRFPRVVVVNEGKAQDFLAWVVTYFPNLRPFTAYCRVVERSLAELSLSLFRKPCLGRFEDACAGIILCETASYLDGRQDFRALSSLAGESTYSFCMSRALALGVAEKYFDLVTDNWSEARELTKQPQLSNELGPIRPIWAAMFQLSRDQNNRQMDALPPELMEILFELLESGEIREHSLDRITRRVPLPNIHREMNGPREERVQLLNRTLGELASGEPDNENLNSFLAGLLTAYVGPGTLDYTALLRPHLHRLPGALVWYGLIAGLQGASSVQSFGMGLGRRIIRDVLRNEGFLDLPTCDISMAELSVISRASSFDFRTASRNHIEIEIAPCTNVMLRLYPTAGLQGEMFPVSGELNSEMRRIDSEIDSVVSRLEGLQNQIQRLTGKTRDTEDRKVRRRK
jgi:hypothetical protein